MSLCRARVPIGGAQPRSCLRSPSRPALEASMGPPIMEGTYYVAILVCMLVHHCRCNSVHGIRSDVFCRPTVFRTQPIFWFRSTGVGKGGGRLSMPGMR